MTKNPARACVIEAPCKINLHLSIGEQRPDGFHALESLFASLALADTLRFERAGKDGECGVTTHWEGRGESSSGCGALPGEKIPLEKNLVYRAVMLFRERTGFRAGLNIHLHKRIPAGAGLGGGSSDAASTLLAMDALAGTSLSPEALLDMAAVLGSDAPFFLSGGAAFVSGRGDRIEAVKPPEGLRVVLAKPPFPSDTASSYRLIDEAREHGVVQQRKRLSKEALIRALGDDPAAWPFYNDFLPVFLERPSSREAGNESNAGMYAAILAILRKYGASFTGLSGSGSCCFGIYDTIEAAERAVKAFAAPGKLAGKESLPCAAGGHSRGSQAEVPARENFARSTFFLARRPDPVLDY